MYAHRLTLACCLKFNCSSYVQLVSGTEISYVYLSSMCILINLVLATDKSLEIKRLVYFLLIVM